MQSTDEKYMKEAIKQAKKLMRSEKYRLGV